jgi:hypothetical protein
LDLPDLAPFYAAFPELPLVPGGLQPCSPTPPEPARALGTKPQTLGNPVNDRISDLILTKVALGEALVR